MPDTNENMLEQTFSSLAYTSMRDKAPGLLDYLIGFQMLKQEDEGKRAVGIFGFEIDDKVYYSPIFFLNGEIRGLDAVYSVDSDLFMPITDDWVNAIINKQNVRVGEADTRGRDERGVRVPNYMRLKTVPSSHGSVNLKTAEAWALPRNDKIEDLPTLAAETGFAGMLKQAMIDHPKLLNAFECFYNFSDIYENEPIEKVAAEKPVTIITSVTDEGVKDLTDKQREEIVSGGVAVMDKRPEATKSTMYSTEAKERLENPTGGGLYDVLCADGSVEPAIIAQLSNQKPMVFVYCLKSGQYCAIEPRFVHVVRQYNMTEYAKEMEKITKLPSKVSPKEVVVFLSASGVCTGGYRVEEKTKGLDESTVLTPCGTEYMNAGDKQLHGYPAGYGYQDLNVRTRTVPDDRVQTIIITDRGGQEPLYVGNKLVINDKCFGALVLKKTSDSYNPEDAELILNEGDFGDYQTIVRELQKSASAITVWKNDHNLTVQDDNGTHVLNKVASFRYLINEHGMREEDIRILLDTSSPTPETFYIKRAAENFPQMPADDIDRSMGNEMSAFHPTQIHVGWKEKAQPSDNRDFYTYESPFGGGGNEGEGVGTASSNGGGGPDALGLAQRGAATGQKEVFDASILGSLIKSHAPTEVVDRFLPTIISGMDRLGRLLFLIHWHYKDFEERYGENDISEFIDNLRSTFSDLGDVVIFAKKRTLSGDPDHYGLGMEKSRGDA